jgi:hypothetical protein
MSLGRCTQQFGGIILTEAVGIVPTPIAAISIAASSTSKPKIAASARSRSKHFRSSSMTIRLLREVKNQGQSPCDQTANSKSNGQRTPDKLAMVQKIG